MVVMVTRWLVVSTIFGSDKEKIHNNLFMRMLHQILESVSSDGESPCDHHLRYPFAGKDLSAVVPEIQIALGVASSARRSKTDRIVFCFFRGNTLFAVLATAAGKSFFSIGQFFDCNGPEKPDRICVSRF
jgi:hypothetical protein